MRREIRPPEPGIALSRDHPARQATDDWTLLPPEFGPASAIHYGTLKGLEGVDGGRPLILMPYLSGQGLKAERATGGLQLGEYASARVGGDVRMNMGEGVWLELSALTDFAQVDLDDALLNLDRFPLFFPERRTFFLNGTDVFSFGAFGASQPFFSRRIGLTAEGKEVPLYGGFKLYSRAGKLRYGLLSTLSGQADDDPLGSSTVARARYEIKDGFIGFILTHQREVPSADISIYETGFGVDLSQRFFNKKLELSAAYSGFVNEESDFSNATPLLEMSDDSSESVDLPQSINLEATWRGEDYQTNVSALYVDEDYNPRLGFVRRTGVVATRAQVTRVFYKPLGLNRFTLGPIVELSWDDTLSQSLDRKGDFGFGLVSETGWQLNGAAGYLERVVNRDGFDLASIEIAQGAYSGPNGFLRVTTPYAGARVRGGVRYQYDGAFFGGVSHSLNSFADLSLSRYLRLKIDYVYSNFDVRSGGREGDGQEQAWNTAVAVTPTTTLQVDLVGQLNTQADLGIAMARLRWRWAPGSDLFLVYRARIPLEEMAIMGEPTPQREDQLMFKIVWRNDILF